MIGYVEDNYVLEGRINKVVEEKTSAVIHDDLEFSYRPATRLEVVRLDAALRVAGREEFKDAEAGVKVDEMLSEFVANHVVSWGVTGAGGVPVPCTKLTLNRIHENLYQRLYFIIRGVSGSDPKPNGKAPLSDEQQVKN